jgi:N6-L-threonylcarbamoyladenine synthase
MSCISWLKGTALLCLGIESSCDETAFALVEGGRILGQTLHSQVETHALFGGVVPELASREHGRAAAPLFDALLRQCGREAGDIDLIAVARGPGLLGSLLVGVAFAKGLAVALGRPVLGVNHLHAHVLAAGLEQELLFPALALLVSGGHTNLYLVRSPVHFILLGRTLDDAAGEALDKFGKMLGLPYPAGRHIDEFAALGEVREKLFPRPYLHSGNLDFSFSGLKTAALNLLEKQAGLRFSPRFRPEGGGLADPVLPEGEAGKSLAGVCASYLYAVASTLSEKTRQAAIGAGEELKAVILAGGVAANRVLRGRMEALCRELELPLLLPSPALCADNAAMIAHAGALLFQAGRRHDLDFPVIPRGRLVPDDYRLNLC